ncbi:uncharacterized protein LOC128737846 [Sabethes cyaneus]|uniref:uncharacterized protein LOC128737846 n=1 Tax=Sabethes cyaneus TaxID=53552 RepID=UPI00237EAAEB|nr:uncharacterized protein LOC128737846 [Sabethes cyaneus]
MKCKALYCNRSRRSNPDLHFYRFPKNKAIRREWIRFCVRHSDEIPFMKLANSRLCSFHFPDGKGTRQAPNIPTRRDPKPEADSDDEENPIEISEDFSLRRKEIGELQAEITRLRREVDNQKRIAGRWKSRYCRLQHCLTSKAESKLFREDQMKLLTGAVTKVKNWSPETIIECEQLWKACPGGYNALIKRGFPLPSIRTLQRQIGLVRSIIEGEEAVIPIQLPSTEIPDCDLEPEEQISEPSARKTITTKVVIEPVYHDHRGYYAIEHLDEEADVEYEIVTESVSEAEHNS